MEAFLLDNIFWLLMAAVSSAGLSWTFVRGGKLTVSPQAAVLSVGRGGGLFLDVRSTAEFSTGHLPRSQNIPADNLAQRLDSLIAKYKEKPVVIICQNGMRSRQAAQQMQKQGFTNVRVLAGGLNAWQEAHLPIIGRKK